MPMERSHPAAAAEVVAVEVVAGAVRAEEWSSDSFSGDGGDTLQGGDVVEEIRVGGSPAARAPFKGGRAAVLRMLHAAFKRGSTSMTVGAKRGDASVEFQGCVVPHGSPSRKHYVVRSIRDPNYAVRFIDLPKSECIAIQGSRSSRVVSALCKAQLQDGYVSYPWEKKLKASQTMQNYSSFLSLLVLPMASDSAASRYHCLEDTMARAEIWLKSSQASGVPIVFMNIQTEALLTKISGEMASSTVNTGSVSDLSNLANESLYGFEDYHGVDIGVVRAIRLWYSSAAGEMPVEIKLQEGDTRLGFAISRTDEGFIYISSVIDNDEIGLPSTRSGLLGLYKEAARASKLLVISRVSNEKVLPWMVSVRGAIRCFDTVSLSQKLSLHRHALQPIIIYVLMWEKPSAPPIDISKGCNTPVHELQPSLSVGASDMVFDSRAGAGPGRDTAGEVSFRFHDFSLPNNWV